MAKHSITEAAKLAGISRTNFYKNYINKGKISVSTNQKGQKEIDTAELLRVFVELQLEPKKITEDDTINTRSDTNSLVLLERIKGLENLLQFKDDELNQYRQREQHYRVLLGQDKTENNNPKKRGWWFSKK